MAYWFVYRLVLNFVDPTIYANLVRERNKMKRVER